MPDNTTRSRGRNRQKIPRIGSKDAARVFEQCQRLLDGSPDLLENLRRDGFARFLAPLHEQILELAVQPDSWGERTRGRLIAEVFASLRRIPAEQARVRKSRTLQTLWCRASFWNWDSVDGILRSNFLLIPAIPLHGLASAWGHPLPTIPSAVTN